MLKPSMTLTIFSLQCMQRCPPRKARCHMIQYHMMLMPHANPGPRPRIQWTSACLNNLALGGNNARRLPQLGFESEAQGFPWNEQFGERKNQPARDTRFVVWQRCKTRVTKDSQDLSSSSLFLLYSHLLFFRMS